MAEEIRVKLIVDSTGSTNTIKQLEATVLSLQKKLQEVKATSTPIIPKEAITPALNSIDALKTKLTDLKKQLGAAEIGTDGFKQLSIQIKATEDQLKNAATAVKGIDAAPAAGSINELKQRVKEATAEINNVAVGSKRFKELELSIFQSNSELRNLKADLKGVTDEKLIGSFLSIGKGAVAGFGAASSAVSLFSANSKTAEQVQRAMAKAQEYLTLVTTLSNIQLAIEESREARLTIAQKGRAVITGVLTAAQAALNAVMSANPIALIVLAVAGLVTGLILLKDKFAIVGKAAEIAFAPIKFLIDGFQKLGNAMGLIGDEQTKKLGKSIAEQRQLVLDKYTQEIALAKAAGKETDQLEIRKLQAAKSFAEFDLARLAKKNSLTDEEIAKQKELEKTVIDSNNEIAVIKVAADKRAADESAKNNKVEVKEVKDAAAEKKALYDKELAELEDRNRVAILKTQEGTAERTQAEINAITSERDFKLKALKDGSTQEELLTLDSQNKIVQIKKDAADRAKEIADDLVTREFEVNENRIDRERRIYDALSAAYLASINTRIQNTEEGSKEMLDLLEQERVKIQTDITNRNVDEIQALQRKFDEETKLRDNQLTTDLEKLRQSSEYKQASLIDQQAKEKKLVDDAAIEKQAADDELRALEEQKTQESQDRIVAIKKAADKKILDEKQKGIKQQIQIEQSLSGIFASLKEVELEGAEGNEKKKKEIAKRYAAFELALGLAMIASNTALSITSATTSGPLGFLVIPTLVASGIAQAAVLIAQKAKVLSLATGGMVPGKGGPKDDDVPAMLSAGESVINARSTQMFAPLLSAINVAGGGVAFGNSSAPRFADGVISVPASSSTTSLDRLEGMMAELTALVHSEASKPVNVVESDITRTQKRVSVIESRSTIG